MGLNETPGGERKHIAFFGCRNAGKSSLLNAVTGQDFAIVSDVAGTTTDPVYKSMELAPAGPVVIIDTPGLDDVGELGAMRVRSALKVLQKTDLAVLVVDSARGLRSEDREILKRIEERNIPCIVVFNKNDLAEPKLIGNAVSVSANSGNGIFELKEKIAAALVEQKKEKPIAADLVSKGDIVVLVIPIDKAAPKGRLILPQQQVMRDLLDHGMIPVAVRDSELEQTLHKLQGMVSLVITDSQAFQKVSGIVPKDLPLTSFSILFARYKGELDLQLRAIEALHSLKDGDRILISEGCTHHRQCGDIGTEKIPALLKRYGNFDFDFTGGQGFPEDLKKYALIIHCGGCMLNQKEMQYRIETAKAADIPITNYGMFLAAASGVLERSIAPLKRKGALDLK